ncbi:hypothetical protein CWI38_1875p0010 [Hamiltosporidium tvaerminnensis]|uniref:Uncharacterized protein n=2 Tax=Hamiltosporidium TaxID=1176354 RepID=A0A4Q9LGL8_9MICR|nr:hypothetical protein CWI39_0561p0020 [Hamiltosporidium magnivora]TBU10289.1 hypothetical protein CWI38_1875p0010 [Hamiltosporidium tvaerminnensis]
MLFFIATLPLIFLGMCYSQDGETDAKTETNNTDIARPLVCENATIIEISEEDKKVLGQNPGETDIAREARLNGLVPVSVYTIFANPLKSGQYQSLPSTLSALSSSMFHMAANGSTEKNGQNFNFIKGMIETTVKPSDNKTNEKPPAEEGGEEGEGEEGGEGGAAAPEQTSGLKPKKKGSKLKAY